MTMIEKFTISRDDSIYECFPDVCMTDTGRLVITYRESDGHSCQEYSHLLCRTSDDQGQTWSDKLYLVKSEAEGGVLFKWNCPRVSQLADGRVIILCDGYPVPPGEGGSQYDSKIFLWTSEDDGATFTGPVETPVCGIVPDKAIQLASGRVLLASHVRDDDLGVYRQMVHISDDGAATWRGPITVCATHHYQSCEGGIVQLPGGELVCYMRDNSRTGIPGPKCISWDEGEDWLGPFDTMMDGLHRPAVGMTDDGEVMVLYRFMPGGPFAKNFFAYKETVDSALAPMRANQTGIIAPLDHDRNAQSDSSYSGWVHLPDGRFFAVNYIKDDAPMAQIRGYYFTADEF